MEDILKGMAPDKRDKIINSVIDEFTKFPYSKASTNNIVKNAGISKGLLFHYFVSKKDLYEKTVRFVINKLVSEVTASINWDETDILERIKQAVILKMKLRQHYPNMFDFLLSMLKDTNIRSVEDVMKIYEKHGIDAAGIIKDMYTKNIDYSKFKDQSSIDKSINIIRWTLEKYAEERYMYEKDLKSFDYEQAVEAIDVYIDVLKKAFY